MREVEFCSLEESDWDRVRKIYEEGIATGDATFETEAPAWKDWDSNHIRSCRVAAVVEGQVVGWAALWPASDRCVYGGVAEVSVYLSKKVQGLGLGTRLLERLVHESESHGFWTLQAGIFPENKSSVRIHEKCGFRVLGYRERLGKMGEVWRDVLLMERRSQITGIG